MTAITVTTPDISGTINQDFFLRPIGGPGSPINYLDRFPEEVYNQGIDSHLVKLLYTLLGPAGVGWLRKNYLLARLDFEDYGLSTFNLDRFYGDPFRFGRILEESNDVDPSGLLSLSEWQTIQQQDASYRNRAIDYMNGARAGNTPHGIQLVARSGLGHDVEIIENYQYIYDQISDDSLGLTKFGTTDSTEEFIVLPRRELPASEVQTVTITGTPTGGTWTLFFPMGNEVANTTTSLAFNITRQNLQTALENLSTIGAGNVFVTGGPAPDIAFEINFTNDLGDMNLPKFIVTNSLTGPSAISVTVDITTSGVSQNEEIVSISPQSQYDLKTALAFIKPVASIVTYGKGSGSKSTQVFTSPTASSAQYNVTRYVTGQTGIRWPTLDNVNWIEASKEHEGLRGANDTQHHYQGFHNVVSLVAYTESALTDPSYLTDIASVSTYRNEHIGPFTQYQQTLFPVLNTGLAFDYQYTADQAKADYAEPLVVTNATNSDIPISLINGIYPVSYTALPGVPPVQYLNDQFWASSERATGDDYLEIDLGQVEAVNYLYFEITQKPYDIELAYDLLDLSPQRGWAPVTFDSNFPAINALYYNASTVNPWATLEFHFNNNQQQMIYTRRLRLKLARRNDDNSIFVSNGTEIPYSIEIRNLRVGRNVS